MNNKRKGYILVIVMVLSLILSITAVSTFTIVMRYMFHAKENIGELNMAQHYVAYQEDFIDGRF